METESKLDEGKSVKNQYLAAIICNVMTFSYGCAEGWMSPFISMLSSETDTILDKPLTLNQVSSVASMVCIGALFGTFIYGIIADKYGRKTALLISAIPSLLCWILTMTWRTAIGLMIARILAGLSGAGPFSIGSLYCVEIASLKSKGALGSLLVFSMNLGILAMYIIGEYLGYDISSAIMIALPILFFVVMMKMPETPIFLVKQKKYTDAANAISWLRSESLDSQIVKRILDELKRECELADINTNEKIPVTRMSTRKNISPWKFFFTSPPTLKAFSVCFLLLIVQIFTGIFVIIAYANEIFERSGSKLSPSTNSIIIAILQILGSIVAYFVIEKMGRKVLLISSCAVVAIGNATIGGYFYAINNGHDVSNLAWIPVTALSFVVFFIAVGIGPIPFLLPAEIIMVQGRSLALSIMFTWAWIASFIVAQTFQQFVEYFGSHSAFWLYAAFAAAGVLLTLFFLPETKGKAFESNLAFYCTEKEKRALFSTETENEELYNVEDLSKNNMRQI